MPLRWRLLLFGYPALELITMYVLAMFVGWGWALIAVLAGIPVGIVVMRYFGARGDALGFFGGVLLAIPGLWSDLVALAFIIPITRRHMRGRMDTWVQTRVSVMRFPGAGFDPTVIQGEVIEGDVIQGDVIDPD